MRLIDLDSSISEAVGSILGRAALGGGFAQRLGGEFRADATAWSVLALTGWAAESQTIKFACQRLASIQLPDGRVAATPSNPNAYWPTPLAVLAWKKAGGFKKEIELSTNFLLATSGLPIEKKDDSPAGHDTKLKGWSWIENTHSWIEPTSIAVMALTLTGHAQGERVQEAIRMMIDRQLPSGGWNYGNTTVFSRELLPMPEHTGQALCALSRYAQADQVRNSIDYARDQLPKLVTPLSLCWCIFGLSAWSVELNDVRERVLKCLSLQERFGAYDTTLLAQLVLAYISNGDLIGFLNN